MNRVVKCKNKKCEQYFMPTEKNTKCPFCYTEYGEREEETKEEKETAKISKKHSRLSW
jgi:hypothetical protein